MKSIYRSPSIPGDDRGSRAPAIRDLDQRGPTRTSRPCWGASRSARAPFPGWPRFDQRDEKNILDVLHSGKWFRGGGDCVNRFEAAYADLTGRQALRGHRQRHRRPLRPRWRRSASSRATR